MKFKTRLPHFVRLGFNAPLFQRHSIFSWALSFLAFSLISAAPFLAGQIPQKSTPGPTVAPSAPRPKSKPVLRHPVTARSKAVKNAVILPPKPVAEPAPQPVLPDWPANDKPTPATVTWNSQGLLVTASNSSLAQILSDISTATGTEIDGFSNDQRIFGSYGPGQTREILSQLLQGTGYNVVMVGDQGQGTPRHMLLSTRNATSAAVGKVEAKSSDDEDADDDEPAPPPTPQPVRPMPGGPPRTPLEMMQQRQQQMQQQRGQQPPNPPN